MAKDMAFGEKLADSVKEGIDEDLSPFYPPDDDVMDNTRSI